VSWQILYTKQAQKDAKRLASAGLKEKTQGLLRVLEDDPFQSPPPFAKLVGDLSGAHSRRVNIQHRQVYQSAGRRTGREGPEDVDALRLMVCQTWVLDKVRTMWVQWVPGRRTYANSSKKSP
jgi:toxin YoeB